MHFKHTLAKGNAGFTVSDSEEVSNVSDFTQQPIQADKHGGMVRVIVYNKSS